MTNQEMTNVIFTKDEAYAYKLRNKLTEAKIKAGYVTDTETLLFHMFNNNKGIILIDLKYARFLNIITEYCNHQFSKNFCFVFLNDNRNCEVKFDNKLIFLTNFKNVIQTIELAQESIDRQEKQRFLIPENYVENQVIKMLANLDISTKYAGYDLIKDAIKILVKRPNRDFLSMKQVYQEIGEMHGKDPSNVEKSIRLALKRAEAKSPKRFEELFRNTSVSNTILLYYISENIKNSYHNSLECDG